MDQEILKADPAYRKTLLVTILVTLIAGSLVIGILLPGLTGISATDNPAQAVVYIKWIIAVLFLPLLLFCLYLVVFAIQTWRQGVFPPQNTKVIRDTPVLRGKKARQRAMTILILCLIMLSILFYAAYLVDRLFVSLLG